MKQQICHSGGLDLIGTKPVPITAKRIGQFSKQKWNKRQPVGTNSPQRTAPKLLDN